MTRLRLSIISALAVVGVAASLVIQQQAKLREENRLLRQQMEQLAPLQAQIEHLSNLLAQAHNAQTLPSAQIRELLRFRSEVGSLRRQTNELGKLQSENQRLRSSLLASKAGTQTELTRESSPKESWGLVGYADPDAGREKEFPFRSQTRKSRDFPSETAPIY